jgi:predicted ArsR family transcriptional regulator
MSVTKETRRLSYLALEPKNRKEMILQALAKHGPMTAREIKDVLGFDDMDAVRPRLTDLMKKDRLIKAERMKTDDLTGKPVAVFELMEP